MSMVIYKKTETDTEKDVIEQFRKFLEEKAVYLTELEKLVRIYQKFPTDKFIISEFNKTKPEEVAQGDIWVWVKGSYMYNKYIKRINDLLRKGRKPLSITRERNLQDVSTTSADHLVVESAKGSVNIYTCSGIGEFGLIDMKLVKAEKPFLLVHREHGNIAFPAGEYLTCSAIDPSTMRNVID